jgi:catechol 2,3-dioxygenase-like lactoylglutathione lyase family enzyme
MPHLAITQQITFLYTRNLSKTAHFYEDIVGLPLILDQGNCRIYRLSGDGYLGFCQRADAPQPPSGVMFTIVTPQVDQWYQHLQAQGVVFETPPTLNPTYNIYHCILRDPNGYLIEIQQFLDPTWPKMSQTSDKG